MRLDEITSAAEAGVATITLDRPAMLNAISGRPEARATRSSTPWDWPRPTRRGQHRARRERQGVLRRRRPRAATCAARPWPSTARSWSTPTCSTRASPRARCRWSPPCTATASAPGCCSPRRATSSSPAPVPRSGSFLMLTGESITAEQARQIGLVLAIEPVDELHERVLELARRIARLPRESVLLNHRARRSHVPIDHRVRGQGRPEAGPRRPVRHPWLRR